MSNILSQIPGSRFRIWEVNTKLKTQYWEMSYQQRQASAILLLKQTRKMTPHYSPELMEATALEEVHYHLWPLITVDQTPLWIRTLVHRQNPLLQWIKSQLHISQSLSISPQLIQSRKYYGNNKWKSTLRDTATTAPRWLLKTCQIKVTYIFIRDE